MNTRMCKVKDCLCIAKWVPGYVVTMPDNDRKFDMLSNLDICDIHKNLFTLKDLLTDDMLKAIQIMFKNSVLTEPKRENFTLYWQEILPASLEAYLANGAKFADIPLINRPEKPR
jgi:hypothetical protein